MAVGNATPLLGHNSAIAVMEETTYGTFVTATANFIEFNSESLNMVREPVKLESVNFSRNFTKRIVGNESVSGSIEADLDPGADGLMLLLKQGMGGTVTTVDNTSASADEFAHTFAVGNMESNKATATSSDVKSLSLSAMRGGTATVFLYEGVRVSSFTIKGEVGSPVVVTYELMGQHSSITTTMPAISYSDLVPLYFKDITIKTGDSIGNVGTTEFYTSFEVTVNNNIDSDQRALGSREVVALPPSKREVLLKLGQRFDTTTSYDRAIGDTLTAIQIELSSEQTVGAGTVNSVYSMFIKLPEVFFNSNEPQVGGNEVLAVEIEGDAMYNSDAGYDIQLVLYNATANYA